ncbi:MAG TPA: PAS domain S-box protein [Gemmatimonadales bacterium]|jgi:PAS domain S-box-containing protein|nr:PAS domain S-box protein [Gemmatimonadales bacterium]
MTRRSWNWSIERKLPLLFSILLLAVVLVMLGAAYQQVRHAALAFATGRLKRIAKTYADALPLDAANRRKQSAAMAADPGVQEFVMSGGTRGRDWVLAAMRRIAPDTSTTTVIEVWDTAGHRLILRGDSALHSDSAAVQPLDSTAVGPYRVRHDTLMYVEVQAAVRQGNEGRVIGRIVQVRRAVLSKRSRELMMGIAGGDVAVLIGNADGAPWTDLEHLIPAPPADARKSTEPTLYQRGEAKVGIAGTVAGTPWMFMVELSREQLLAPSLVYLRSMSLIAVLIVVVGAIGAWWVSRRITDPLRHLTTAAAAIAGGDLEQRVNVLGTDELGRLGQSFNVMASEVKRSREDLEAKVVERTHALRDSEARLRSVTETAHDAIIAADADGNISYWNPGAAHMFGYAVGEVVGRPLTLLMPERYQEDHRRGIRRYVDTAEARVVGRTVELHGRRKDGGEFPLELSLAAARTAAGTSFTGVIRDITERKRIELALRETNAELEAFSYSVSHDLRAPLRAIHGFARILLEDHGPKLDPEAKRVLSVIDENTRRMGQLIDDLLSFSRLGRKELETARVDMAELVRQVVDETRRNAGARALEITVGSLPPARGDRNMLRQAVTNLLDNAAKFTRKREPGRIEVGYQANGAEPVYYVKDNGAGFDPRYASKLFGVFQRLHRAEEFEGTGVGLAIVQRVVTRHGGRVWAEGKLDAGATFYFTLPGVSAV